MKGYVDLHVHTTASDGTLTPSQAVVKAKQLGLSAIAITDHDNVEGLEEGLNEADKIGLELICGIEISADFSSDFHILGYFKREGYRKIDDFLENLREERFIRNEKIIKKLNELGYEISMSDIEPENKKAVVGRPHIASVLVQKGYFNDIWEVFGQLIGRGKPAYFKKEKIPPEKCISEIRQAGGIPVMAHPVHLGLNYIELEKIVKELITFGLLGIEAYHPDHSETDIETYLGIASRHNLIFTGGSDYHGKVKPDIEMGTGRGNLRIPYASVECINKYLEP